mgnify:CR=1 FL=1
MSVFGRISNRVLMITNVIAALLFLLACIIPRINPQSWPLVSLIGLAFPFLMLIVLCFLICWLFIKRKWALVSAIAIVLGGGQIVNFFGFHFWSDFNETKKENQIRIASWNVARFIEMVKNNNKGSQTRYKMLQQIKQANADILCLQEFSSSINPDWYNNIVAVSKGLDYPYYYFSHDWDGDRLFNGSVIFSRYPIADTGLVRYPRPTLPDALVFVDIQKDNEHIRVYTSHLQSNQFRPDDISKIEELKGGKGFLGNAPYIFKKLATAIAHRGIQADLINDITDNSPHPLIFCGDLNDVPNSYIYNTVKGNLQDAFLQKGFGIGRTYSSISPTLRIDYIFADKRFKVEQFKRITTNYSDHYMIVADVELKPTQ